jgi:hypothetical protein
MWLGLTRGLRSCAPALIAPVGAAGGFYWLVSSSSLSIAAEISEDYYLGILFGAG